MRRRAVFALAAVLGLTACRGQSEASADPGASGAASPSSGAARKMLLTDAPPEGEVEGIVRAEIAKANADHRRVVVYEGAKWCEPCQRFHQAAQKGELDSTFPDVDLLVFDADRDGERMAAAGYKSKYIPLFVLPQADGRSSGMQIEGGVKGDGAVKQIAPRLQHMLEQ
jgi:thiol-disulfide isomerase/thioredoxin